MIFLFRGEVSTIKNHIVTKMAAEIDCKVTELELVISFIWAEASLVLQG